MIEESCSTRSDRAGWRALRPQSPVSRGRRHGSNPGTSGWPGQRVPIRVPRIRHVTEREHCGRTRRLHGDRAVNDLVAEARAVRDLVPQLAPRRFPGRSAYRGRRCAARSSGQRDETPRAPGAGPLRGGRRGPRAGRQDVRRGDDGRRAGHHDDGGQTVPGRRRDAENTPFLRSLVERGLDVSQGLRSDVPRLPPPRCNGVSGTRARTWCVTWPSVSRSS